MESKKDTYRCLSEDTDKTIYNVRMRGKEQQTWKWKNTVWSKQGK